MKDKKLLTHLIVLVIAILLVVILGVINKNVSPINNDGLRFKEEYEALNSSIPLTISENNPIKYLDFDGVEQLFASGTGVIYFGFPSCPWCRNIIPVLFNTADRNNWDKIYYVNPRELKKDEQVYNKLLEISKITLLSKSLDLKMLKARP